MSTSSYPTLFLFRHGETQWSKSGQHTGRTDVPLTENGRAQAAALRKVVEHVKFQLVLTSPLSRARQTAEIAGLGAQAQACDELTEVDYGEYEGITTVDIRKSAPGWTVWTHPCVGGETLESAASRVVKVIERTQAANGPVALFAHGHILRILTAVYLELPPTEGKHFMLDTSCVSILSREHETPAIRVWNAPVLSDAWAHY